MTLEELAQQIARGFAAIADGQKAVADGQKAIADELRATRVHLARIKGQREMDLEAHEADLNALGSQVQEVEKKLRLVTPRSFPAVIPPDALKPAHE